MDGQLERQMNKWRTTGDQKSTVEFSASEVILANLWYSKWTTMHYAGYISVIALALELENLLKMGKN